jgi:hypothetical protein
VRRTLKQSITGFSAALALSQGGPPTTGSGHGATSCQCSPSGEWGRRATSTNLIASILSSLARPAALTVVSRRSVNHSWTCAGEASLSADEHLDIELKARPQLDRTRDLTILAHPLKFLAPKRSCAMTGLAKESLS